MILSINNKLVSINGKLSNWTEPPPPVFPTDMDFVYQAKDWDGTKIPNKALNSTWGDYLGNGNLTLNGSGSTAYLSSGKSNTDYLYKNLTQTELDNIKAVNGTYTWFIRMYTDDGGTGGIMSCRSNGGYIYMIRCNSRQLQIHDRGGHDCGSNFMMNVDRVYKVQVSGMSYYAKNMETGDTWTYNSSATKSMGTKMTTFNAGFSGEYSLDRFYAFAGIPRATTEEEDTLIANVLMNQSA